MFSYSPLHANFFKGAAPPNEIVKSRTEFLNFVELCDYFFVSHPNSGRKEGSEHERVMFYYPPSETISRRTEITGMAEAVVDFTNELSDSIQDLKLENHHTFRYVTSTSSKEVVLVVEDGSFLVGASLNRKKCKTNQYFPHLPTLRTIIENTYRAYKLFNGTFTSIFTSGATAFKVNLDRFFTPYLQLLRVNKTPLVDFFNGVDFLSMDPVQFLEIDCLMTSCMEEFPVISNSCFFYQDRLAQYNLKKSDLIPICQFMNKTLIPSAMQAELSPQMAAARNNQNFQSKRNGFVVSGELVVDFHGDLSKHLLPIVYLSAPATGGPFIPFELIAYRVRSATACFFVQLDALDNNFAQFVEDLFNFLDAKLTTITSKMGNETSKPVQSDILYHFIYFNPDSLSLRKSFSSFCVLESGTDVQLPPSSIFRLVYETYDRFITDSSLFGQVFVKAENDWWIVFKKISKRILVLFIQQTIASTISDIEYYVENIVTSNNFKILFIP